MYIYRKFKPGLFHIVELSDSKFQRILSSAHNVRAEIKFSLLFYFKNIERL